ncbi:hypothetical protein C8A05DRAFT_17697 [Staphylotrichum tortipilum]|uniref:Gastric mucin-like protein n=1 Tax=Staphylotrichum tortipilum TaxID=2831512 RepID=A0AAN6MFK2_9PEZI|nr:hypothetical protein C8A05DRAFT_17697 [Staphylotrichum longicolle]
MAMRVSLPRDGHIVALEGPADLVSTQLRLLPASHQILVLPGLENYMAAPNPDAAAPLGVCEHIHEYHLAYQTRHAEALEFLRSSSQTGETRLVFLHGGAMSAHVACLSTIMEHETEGDIEEAHATLIRLASNGDETPTPEPVIEEQSPQQNYVWGGLGNADADVNPAGDTMGDRFIQAMRAADALDKETEFLQPATPDIDLTVRLVDIPSWSRKRLNPTAAAAASPETLRPFRPRSPRDLHESHPAETVPRVSPVDATEQAVSAAPRKPLLRIQIPSPPTPKPTPWAAASAGEQQTLSKFCYPQGPGHKRSRTADSCHSPTQLPETDEFAADQDSAEDAPLLPAEARDQHAPTDKLPATPDNDPVEEVLPVREDFVVYLTPETPCELQEFVFRRLSEGCAKTTPRLSVSAPPPPPLMQWRDSFRTAGETSQLILEDGPEADDEAEETRTEEGEGSGAATPWVCQDLVHGLPTPNHSPTSFQGPEAEVVPRDTRLYSIDVDEETAVCIQNFLRPFLATLFPLQARRFSAADGAEFPGESSLWKVLECDDQVTNANGEARLDLILAVGAESGVKKNRLAEIVGQLDQLGFKTSGLSRSGRLDIRYVFLIANAMQAFTAQPLTKQTQSNPFVNRALLAALIIPHLETYLSTHPDVRFLLIEYPSEHLPTVLALQTLIGTEMMKVVGIINSDAPPRSSLAVPEMERRPSEGFRSLSRRGSRKSGTFTGPCSFSKGNFLLASSATGFETAAFVAAIRESLISISDFYIPDRPLYRHPTPLLPPKKPYPALTVNTETPDKKSRQEQDQSTSTLIITPPSSPTETSAPPHAFRGTIPPRSSSFSLATFAGGRPTITNDTPPPTVGGSRIRWGEVNYAPSVSTTASSTTTSSTAATSTTASSTATDKITTTVLTAPGMRGHVKKGSDPLSPDAPPASYPSSSKSAASYPSKSSPSSASSHSHTHAHNPAQISSSAPAATTASWADDYLDLSDEDEHVPDADERRLMPMYLKRRRMAESGGGGKAMRWLGLV